TENGGGLWTLQTSGTEATLTSVSFPDALNGWAVGDASLSTKDGGATWTSGEGYGGDEVTFIDASHGWVVDDYNSWLDHSVIYATSDGGANWTEQYSGDRPRSVTFSDANHGWTVGNAGEIATTTNGGALWSALDSRITDALYSVSFPDSSHGWAVGLGQSGDSIFATTDGGANWNVQSSGGGDVPYHLSSVCFPDAVNGWAVGNNGLYWEREGVILATSDGGAHWTRQSSGIAEHFSAVTFSDASHGWAVGEYIPSGYHTPMILATADGGAHWSAQSSGASVGQEFYAVAFPDASHGWVVGSDGMIRATTNGGATWTLQYSGTSQDINDVTFVDAAHGWAVVTGDRRQSGMILATSDGGVNWRVQEYLYETNLYAVTFPDALHGWAVGGAPPLDIYSGEPSRSVILATSDGGAPWTSQSSGTTQILADVSFSDASHGWMAGSGFEHDWYSDDGAGPGIILAYDASALLPVTKVTLELSGLTAGAISLGQTVTATGAVAPVSLIGSRVTLTVQMKKGVAW
ncbi:MAG: YCF48-related protein, partial [Armatimonadota bacterium]